MPKRSPELGRVLRSDYCPECGRVGCCDGEQDCAEYRRRIGRALRAAMLRHFERVADALESRDQ